MIEIKIDKGVKINDSHHSIKDNPWGRAVSKMVVGDSFLLPKEYQISKVMGQLARASRIGQALWGCKWSYRKDREHPDQYRIWRVSKDV